MRISDAKRYFNKNECAAYEIASDCIKGSPIHWDYLETPIMWISKNNIEKYMARHQHDQNVNELWSYFRGVTDWVETTFTTKRNLTKFVYWKPCITDTRRSSWTPVRLKKRRKGRIFAENEMSRRFTRVLGFCYFNAAQRQLNCSGYEQHRGRCHGIPFRGICTGSRICQHDNATSNDHDAGNDYHGAKSLGWLFSGDEKRDNWQN